MKGIQNLCWDNFADQQSLRTIARRDSKPTRSPPPSRNPFLNFLREFRKQHGGVSSSKVMKMGAEMWRKMNEAQKLLYFELARSAPKRKKRKQGKKKKRGRSRKRR